MSRAVHQSGCTVRHSRAGQRDSTTSEPDDRCNCHYSSVPASSAMYADLMCRPTLRVATKHSVTCKSRIVDAARAEPTFVWGGHRDAHSCHWPRPCPQASGSAWRLAARWSRREGRLIDQSVPLRTSRAAAWTDTRARGDSTRSAELLRDRQWLSNPFAKQCWQGTSSAGSCDQVNQSEGETS